MSYMPDNPYYAWVYLKIGAFEATPIPPEHLISFTCTRGPGTSISSPSENSRDSRTQIFQEGSITLFDETALRVEWQIMMGQNIVSICWGYLHGPNSPYFSLLISKWESKLTKSGSATLTINLVSKAIKTLQHPDYKCYKDMSLLDIVLAVRDENGWKGSPDGDFPTIAPMQDLPHTIQKRDSNDPNKYVPEEHHKTFMRLNQDPISFLQYEVAPYCVMKNEPYLGDYRLWFEDTVTDEEGNAIEGSQLETIVDEVTDYFKGYLTDITDPLTRQKNIAMAELVKIADESLATVSSIIGTASGLAGALSGLSNVLSGISNIAKSAITNGLASIAGDALSGAIGDTLMNAGINAAGDLVDSVTGKIMGKINAVTGEITDAAGNVLGKLDLNKLAISLNQVHVLTNESAVEGFANFEQFRNANFLGRLISKASKEFQGSVMYFKPLPILVEDVSGDTVPISPEYRFELGSSPDSTVLEFDFNNNNAFTQQSGEVAVAMSFDRDTNKPIMATKGKNRQSLRDPSITTTSVEEYGLDEELSPGVSSSDREAISKGTGMYLSLSSSSPEDLERIATSLFYLSARQRAMTATMKIFGDPNIKFNQNCMVTVVTKNGHVHYSSGIYFITKVTDSIQGGVYITSVEMSRYGKNHPDKKSVSSVTGNNTTPSDATNNASDAPVTPPNNNFASK